MASTEPTSSTEGKKNEETTLKSKLPKDYKKVAQLMAGKQGICSSSEGVKLKSAKCGVKRVQYVTGPRIVDWIYDTTGDNIHNNFVFAVPPILSCSNLVNLESR